MIGCTQATLDYLRTCQKKIFFPKEPQSGVPMPEVFTIPYLPSPTQHEVEPTNENQDWRKSIKA